MGLWWVCGNNRSINRVVYGWRCCVQGCHCTRGILEYTQVQATRGNSLMSAIVPSSSPTPPHPAPLRPAHWQCPTTSKLGLCSTQGVSSMTLLFSAQFHSALIFPTSYQWLARRELFPQRHTTYLQLNSSTNSLTTEKYQETIFTKIFFTWPDTFYRVIDFVFDIFPNFSYDWEIWTNQNDLINGIASCKISKDVPKLIIA